MRQREGSVWVVATPGTNGRWDDGRGITSAFALFCLGIWSFFVAVISAVGFAAVALIPDRTGEPTRETATV